MSTQRSYLIIGGAGAQGFPIVKGLISLQSALTPYLTAIALAADYSANVRVLTRNTTSANAQALSAIPNVECHIGSSTSDIDLRTALKSMTHVFVNLNSFALGQKAETYWGIRIFELAVESGVLRYIWSGLDSALRDSGYDENLRCGHYE